MVYAVLPELNIKIQRADQSELNLYEHNGMKQTYEFDSIKATILGTTTVF
jgi:hypothetical protein